MRFKNDPGFTGLATKAYIGRLATKKLSSYLNIDKTQIEKY